MCLKFLAPEMLSTLSESPLYVVSITQLEIT